MDLLTHLFHNTGTYLLLTLLAPLQSRETLLANGVVLVPGNARCEIIEQVSIFSPFQGAILDPQAGVQLSGEPDYDLRCCGSGLIRKYFQLGSGSNLSFVYS